jgi:hypothetical protein
MEKTFRLNCIAATFPLVSTFFGRSTMTRAPEDSNYVITNAYSGTQADRDIGIPMPIYMHNVFPTSYGLQSVGFTEVAPPALAAFPTSQSFIIRGEDESRKLAVLSASKLSVLTGTGWQQWAAPTGEATIAYLHQQTYLCYKTQGVFKVTATGLIPATPAGLIPSTLLGITNLGNYLIVFTHDTVHHIYAGKDATPDLATATGSTKLLHADGAITHCQCVDSAIIVYTTTNAVQGKLTGDPKFPIKYSEIPGSGGVASSEHVTDGYAWTTKGLQALTGEGMKLVFPEVTDFLSGHLIEDYIGATGKQQVSNEATVWSSETQSWQDTAAGDNNLRTYNIAGQMRVKVAHIANRFLVISYGVSQDLNWALVFDSALKRWGKLRIPHTSCIELSTTVTTFEVNHQLGVVKPDGSIVAINLEDRATGQDSVLIFGRLQHTRGGVLTLQAVELENGRPGEMQLSILTSLDGKNFNPDYQPTPQIVTANLTKWLMRTTGINHCIKLTGSFDLVTIQGSCTIGGSR